jgi:uncharacterized membrane protein SirB2
MSHEVGGGTSWLLYTLLRNTGFGPWLKWKNTCIMSLISIPCAIKKKKKKRKEKKDMKIQVFFLSVF